MVSLDLLPFEISALLLLFARIGAFLMVLPVFSEEAIPGQVRLLFALGVSLALYGLVGPSASQFTAQSPALIGTLITELAIGLGLGTLVRFMFQAVVMGASIISLQIGLSSALVFDPALGGQTPVLAKLATVAAALVCMGMNLHHLWLAAVIDSYAVFPLGKVPNAGDFLTLAVSTLSHATALAISLAGPFLVYGIVFNVALGFSARLAPAIQIFFIAQPLNILLGLALLSTTAGLMITTFATAFNEWLQNGWS